MRYMINISLVVISIHILFFFLLNLIFLCIFSPLTEFTYSSQSADTRYSVLIT